jgi:NadR type nicotinamide-nucleotide adenylyltransferase
MAQETHPERQRVKKPVRIAVTGPESTGKSILTQQLAEFFGTPWVPEFAREYIDRLDRPYAEEDILVIAKGQLEAEERQAAMATDALFCDTELTVTRIWSEVKYGHCHPWILEKIREHSYDLYLLCDIDIPWENDPQREHPHLREHLFSLYQNELNGRGCRFEVVSGLGGERLENAIRGIRKNIDL